MIERSKIPQFGDQLYSAGPIDLHALLVTMPNGAMGSFNHTEPSITYLESGSVWLAIDGFSGWIAGGCLMVLPAGVRAFSAGSQTRGISVGLGSTQLPGRHGVHPQLVRLGRSARREWFERTLAFLADPLAERFEMTRRLDCVLSDEIEMRERHRRELIANILATVESSIHRAISLRELGERFGYAPNHLNEIVTHNTGRSTRQWELGFRLEAARMLLKRPNVAVREVAATVGMDAPQFTRAFRARYQLTPSAWRSNVFKGTNLEPLIEEVNSGGVVNIAGA